MSVPTESYAGKIQRKLIKKQRVIEAASGRQKADLVLKNATYVNVFSNELLTCDIAVANGLIVGLGSYEGEVEYDMTGKIVCPGFVDAHIHLESSLVTPKEFVRATLPHGTTTVITDPMRSRTSWAPTASTTCSRPPRVCRSTCGSCCRPASRPRRWTNPARIWTTVPSTRSMTTPGCRVWPR